MIYFNTQDDDDDDDDHFYTALFFNLKQTHCTFVACNSESVAVAFYSKFWIYFC